MRSNVQSTEQNYSVAASRNNKQYRWLHKQSLGHEGERKREKNDGNVYDYYNVQ